MEPPTVFFSMISASLQSLKQRRRSTFPSTCIRRRRRDQSSRRTTAGCPAISDFFSPSLVGDGIRKSQCTACDSSFPDSSTVFPKLKIIIGHMGEGLPYSIVRADTVLARDTNHLQRRVKDYFHEHFYITTSGYFSLPPFLCALQVVGADRILFSIDYPFSPNAVGRDFLNSLPVSPEDMEKIAHRNTERLLNL